MKNLKLFLILALSVVFLASGVWAGNQKPVAEVMVGSFGLSWSPNVQYSKIVLSVATPSGHVVSKTFNAGSTPGFDLSDLEPPVLDGSYTYELRVIPNLPTANLRRGEKLGFETKFNPDNEVKTQTGHFHVYGGAIVNPNLQENPSGVNAQTFTTDLIVQGSGCIGVDCSSNESFGFDTLRLKENNLRIHFNDTSTSGSFPTTDWRIVANDSSNGGASYLRFEDATNSKNPFTVEANSPNNTLYVDSTGRIGVKTSTPVVDIHVKEGNTPTLRLEQDGSDGFQAQTWDVAGNETNFFVRDVSNGSELPFKIKPGADDNLLFLSANNRIGINNGNPTNTVYAKSSGEDCAVVLERTDSQNAKGYFSAGEVGGQGYFFAGSISSHPLRFLAGGNYKMQVELSGNITMSTGGGYYDASNGQWTDGSSREYKEDIKQLETREAIEAFEKLNPVTFKFKVNKHGDRQVGFIAEDVPELVAKRDRKGLAPMDIVAVLTKVVQEQQKQLKQQNETISKLSKKVSDLEKK